MAPAEPAGAQGATAPGGPQRRALWRAIRRQAATLGGAVAMMALTALCISTLAVWLQGRREESRSADVLFVAAPAPPPDALVEHSLELYRRGYAPQVVLVGEGGEALRALLVERGVPEQAVAVAPPAAGAQAQVQAAAAAQRAGASSALVAGAPAELLLWLKLARDAGLRAYGAPTPGESPALPELVAAGARYWGYALLQR
jgi:hypothetical protein